MSSDPKYGATYQAIRRAYAAVVERGEATCSEPICLLPSRTIRPGSKWHLSHDITGTRILGPSHVRCNVAESAIRSNKRRGERFLRL